VTVIVFDATPVQSVLETMKPLTQQNAQQALAGAVQVSLTTMSAVVLDVGLLVH
jgi:hypothetical protein